MPQVISLFRFYDHTFDHMFLLLSHSMSLPSHHLVTIILFGVVLFGGKNWFFFNIRETL